MELKKINIKTDKLVQIKKIHYSELPKIYYPYLYMYIYYIYIYITNTLYILFTTSSRKHDSYSICTLSSFSSLPLTHSYVFTVYDEQDTLNPLEQAGGLPS